MKKRALLWLCCALLLPALAKAQPGSPVKLNAGIKLGVNLAQLNGKDWEDGYKTNLLGGVFARVHNNKVGIQVEAFFSQSSYNTGKDFYDIYHEYYNAAQDSLKKGMFRVNYLNIPVLLQFKLLSRVWIQVGPQYSGIVSVKDMDALLKDAEGLFKNGTVSGVGGLWVDLPFHINVGARYVMGFTDINEKAITDSWKQRNIQIHAGITF